VDNTYIVGKSHKKKRACTLNELKSYYIDDRPPIKSINDPLEWWNLEGKRYYPTLYKIAVDFFSIQATSCKNERIFS
jgi:hAT family C-terminal dimerisation region